MKAKQLFTKVMNFVDDHQREILLGCTIVGVISTGLTAWRNAPKAKELIEKHKQAMEAIAEDDKEARKKETIETVKDVAPLVLPPIAIGTATVLCAVGGHSASSKQIAALSAAYNMAKDGLSEYKDKAKDVLGVKKEREISDEVSASKVKTNPPKTDLIINTGKGSTICYDPKSGRYFYHDAEQIRKAANSINKRMMDEYYISLNEFYDELGLANTDLGDTNGFNIDDDLIDIDHLFSATLDPNDNPVLVLNYDISNAYAEHKGKMFR